MVSDGGKKNDGMRRGELNRMACGWLVRGGIAAVGRASMGTVAIGGENYCGNLLWQLCCFRKCFNFLI